MKSPVLKMTPVLRKVLTHAEEKSKDYLRAEGALLLSLIEVDRLEAFKCYGLAHLTTYCIKQLRLGENVAPIFVRVVRKSHEIPELAQAVVSGRVHLTKAKTIASVITPENKDHWIAQAEKLSKSELEKATARSQGRETSRVTLELTFEEQESLQRVREVLSPKLDHYPTRETAVATTLKFYLNKNDPLAKAHRSRERSREASVEDQVNYRDQAKCQILLPNGKKCEEAKWTHRHHIVPREFGGPDTAANLITLCSEHHRMVHEEMNH